MAGIIFRKPLGKRQLFCVSQTVFYSLGYSRGKDETGACVDESIQRMKVPGSGCHVPVSSLILYPRAGRGRGRRGEQACTPLEQGQ